MPTFIVTQENVVFKDWRVIANDKDDAIHQVERWLAFKSKPRKTKTIEYFGESQLDALEAPLRAEEV